MLKYVIYDADGIQAAEHECELLAVCGFARPGYIDYQFLTDFTAENHEIFACLCHLSAQLQVAARDAMLEATKIADEEGIELDDEFYKDYEDTVYTIERGINKKTRTKQLMEAEDDEDDEES